MQVIIAPNLVNNEIQMFADNSLDIRNGSDGTNPFQNLCYALTAMAANALDGIRNIEMKTRSRR
ncbi:MAG: hypothetical protein ABSA97_06625 [Verrucomicrobiia bacterium]